MILVGGAFEEETERERERERGNDREQDRINDPTETWERKASFHKGVKKNERAEGTATLFGGEYKLPCIGEI